MTFIRCDRCKAEIPYMEKSHTMSIDSFDRANEAKNMRYSHRSVDLCDKCMKGIDMYLQRKVDNYADLMKL